MANTGTQVPVLYQTVLDSNGHPVAGAKIYTYLAGTTTPTTTWTDATLGTPNSNPIIADSAGRWSAYLQPGAGYKFVIQDASGAAIRTIDNVVGLPVVQTPTTEVHTCDGRLTLTSGTPVTVTDVTAATTVYFTPYNGSKIALYDGVAWAVYVFAEIPLPLAGLSANVNRDVFAVAVAPNVTLSYRDWSSDTARNIPLALQDGVLVLSGQPTYRYLGTIRTTGTVGQCEDSLTKRYVWNYAHRVRRPLFRSESTSSWPYTTAAWRQANGNAANQVEVVIGVAESLISLVCLGAAGNPTGGVNVVVGIGEDTVTAPAAAQLIPFLTTLGAGNQAVLVAMLSKLPLAGRHFYAWLEYSTATGTTTWAGSNQGLSGWCEG
jgi:hypothetical protein